MMNDSVTHIKVPEFILLESIDSILNFLKQDIDTFRSSNETWIEKVVGDVGIGRYNYLDQALEVFSRAEDHPRKIKTDLMWNMNRNGAPSIHITLPGEGQVPQGNGMGYDEGYLGDQDPSESQLATVGIPTFSRRFSANYGVAITSDNSNEVVLIYNIIKAGLISRNASINLRGLEKFSLGGQDVSLNANISPQVFCRTLSVQFDYDFSTVSFEGGFIPQSLNLSGSATGLFSELSDTPNNTNDLH